jgi:hypothetical protein
MPIRCLGVPGEFQAVRAFAFRQNNALKSTNTKRASGDTHSFGAILPWVGEGSKFHCFLPLGVTPLFGASLQKSRFSCARAGQSFLPEQVRVTFFGAVDKSARSLLKVIRAPPA